MKFRVDAYISETGYGGYVRVVVFVVKYGWVFVGECYLIFVCFIEVDVGDVENIF